MRTTGKRFKCTRPRTVTYQIWTYDIWGNARDGYEVNDRYKQGKIDLPEEPTDEEVIACLRSDGWIDKPLQRKYLTVDGEPDYSLYLEYRGRPEMELEKVGSR